MFQIDVDLELMRADDEVGSVQLKNSEGTGEEWESVEAGDVSAIEIQEVND